MAEPALLFHQGKRKNTQALCVTAPVRQKTGWAFLFIIAPRTALIHQENYLKILARHRALPYTSASTWPIWPVS